MELFNFRNAIGWFVVLPFVSEKDKPINNIVKVHNLNPLPADKNFDKSKLKQIADDIFLCIYIGK